MQKPVNKGAAALQNDGAFSSFDEMRPSFYVSAAFHFLVLLLIIFGLPLLPSKKIEMPEPISVSMVNPSDMARTNRVDEPTPKPEEPKSVVAPPEPPKPPVQTPPPPAPPTPPAPPAPPTPPAPVPQIKPLQQPLSPIPQLDALPNVAKPMQVIKPLPPLPRPAPPPQPNQKQTQQQDQQFDKLLNNLSKPMPKADQQNQPIAKEAARAPGARATVSDVLTADEMALVRERLKACWIVPAGAYNAENLSIDVQAEFNQDRTLKSEILVDTNDRYNRDPYYKAAADSALRALRNPACDPLPLPPEKYNEWNSMSFRFDPKEMLSP